jgi:hypothetical protein
MIKHFPLTDINNVTAFYSVKDGVPVTYVCTTEFRRSDSPVDIFYRETAHPEFGNRYFGLGYDYDADNYVIFNADKVEDLTFGMVEDDDGNLQYSQFRHDYKSFKNGNMIDGGREYIRSSGNCCIYVVKDGNMIETKK